MESRWNYYFIARNRIACPPFEAMRLSPAGGLLPFQPLLSVAFILNIIFFGFLYPFQSIKTQYKYLKKYFAGAT